MTYLDHLYRVAFHLVRNADEAKDCVQETCTRALSAQGQFLPGSNMKAWLTRILYNFFYDSYARNKRTVAAEDLLDGTDAADFWQAHAGDGPGPESSSIGSRARYQDRRRTEANPGGVSRADPARRHGRFYLRRSGRGFILSDRYGALAVVARAQTFAKTVERLFGQDRDGETGTDR